MESNYENDLKINKEIFITINKGDITQFYEVIKKIREGAYGKIYKVKNKQSGDIIIELEISNSIEHKWSFKWYEKLAIIWWITRNGDEYCKKSTC